MPGDASFDDVLAANEEYAQGFRHELDAGNGVISSISLFETLEQTEESTKLVAEWIGDENLETAIPKAPKITSGKVVAHSDRMVAVA